MVPGHPPCALCSLIFSSYDPETNCSVKLFYPKLVFLNLVFRCAVVKVRFRQTLKTIQSDPRLRIFAIILFERSLTFRFASLKLLDERFLFHIDLGFGVRLSASRPPRIRSLPAPLPLLAPLSIRFLLPIRLQLACSESISLSLCSCQGAG